MAQDSGVKKLVSDFKNTPARVADTATLGPQRRSATQAVSDEVGKATSYLKGQWNQAKDLMGYGGDSDKQAGPDPKNPRTAKPNGFKHGGVVEKTGVALVHKGETVIPAGHRETAQVSHHRVLMSLHQGGLNRALNVSKGTTIPEDKLQSARDSKNPHLRETANLANGMEHWHKK